MVHFRNLQLGVFWAFILCVFGPKTELPMPHSVAEGFAQSYPLGTDSMPPRRKAVYLDEDEERQGHIDMEKVGHFPSNILKSREINNIGSNFSTTTEPGRKSRRSLSDSSTRSVTEAVTGAVNKFIQDLAIFRQECKDGAEDPVPDGCVQKMCLVFFPAADAVHQFFENSAVQIVISFLAGGWFQTAQLASRACNEFILIVKQKSTRTIDRRKSKMFFLLNILFVGILTLENIGRDFEDTSPGIQKYLGHEPNGGIVILQNQVRELQNDKLDQSVRIADLESELANLRNTMHTALLSINALQNRSNKSGCGCIQNRTDPL